MLFYLVFNYIIHIYKILYIVLALFFFVFFYTLFYLYFIELHHSFDILVSLNRKDKYL
jgi:hypothetical protein